MNKERILEILDYVVKSTRADAVEAVLVGGESYLTGFANNYIHRNVGEENYELSIRVVLGKKIGASSTSDLSNDAIDAAIENAIGIAKLQKENKDFVSLPKNYPGETEFKFVSDIPDADTRASIVKVLVDESKKYGFVSSGKFEAELMQLAVKNSLGVERYMERTASTLKNIVMTDTSSGFSQDSKADYRDIDVQNILEESLEVAKMAQNPVSIEPGKYEVILTPYAVEEFLSSMKYLSLSAKNIEEGTSFMKGHFGEKMFPDLITLFDDGLNDETLKMGFDFEGVPKKKVTFIENGVVGDVVYDSFYAYKEGKEPTGHSLPQPNELGAYPMNFFVGKGGSTVEEMISHVEKGLFVQRFWYTNPMEPVTLLITGMTRDGLFLIENGKITKPVKHMRFTESILNAFNNCLEISNISKIIYEDGAVTTAPYMRIKDFNFTSATEF
ncbi:MAG: TldD/PmbA family protein [Caldisericum sp.]|nr:TldD/PmbA family protein [Caldisericum sp.]